LRPLNGRSIRVVVPAASFRARLFSPPATYTLPAGDAIQGISRSSGSSCALVRDREARYRVGNRDEEDAEPEQDRGRAVRIAPM
jgi:hypothetical protein